MKKALSYFFIFAALQLLLSFAVSGLAAVFHYDAQNMWATISSLILSSAIAVALFLRLGWCEVSPHYLRTRPWGVFFWSALLALGLIIPSAWLQEMLPSLPNVIRAQLVELLRHPLGFVAVGLLAPLVEEIVFRGAILRALLSQFSKAWVAILISAVLFAAIHANPAQMPHAFVVGLLLGWMYWRTSSILPGMVYHFVNNSVAYVMANIVKDPDAPLATYFGGNDALVLRAVAFSLCIALPALFQLWKRLKK